MSSYSPAGAAPGNRGRFATTQWRLVLARGESASSEGAEALARLCSLYWYPVFAFVRRQGYPTDKAQDLTQGFFTRLIEKGDFGDATESRGRFRSFLLAACQHFLSNEGDRARALERGGDLLPVSIDVVAAEARYQRALAHGETPEGLYERLWSLTVLAAVLHGLRDEYGAADREPVFKRLKNYLTDEGDGGFADAARDLNMTTTAVKVAVHRLRRRYREELRRRVADTVESDQDIDGEIQHLLQALSRPPGGP